MDNTEVCNRVNKTADVAIWEHVPPPYGGMTIHTKRLIPKVRDAILRVQSYHLDDLDTIEQKIYKYSTMSLIERRSISKKSRSFAEEYISTDVGATAYEKLFETLATSKR